MSKVQKGFTLIELLVVIGILGILLAIVLVALNPARQFAQANNTKRASDVSAYLSAIHQYAADHRGALPVGILETAAEISSDVGEANLCADIMPTYIALLPTDPTTNNNGTAVGDCTSYNTGYTVIKDATGRVTVAAPAAEIGASISVTR